MSEIFSKVSQVKEKIISEMSSIKDESSLKEFQEKHLSKKSELSQLMSEIKNLANDEKAKFGQAMNDARSAVNEAFQKKAQEINDALIARKLAKETIDITLPGYNYKMGGINPFYLVQDEIIDTFVSMGYEV